MAEYGSEITQQDVIDFGIEKLEGEGTNAYNAFLVYASCVPRERGTLICHERIREVTDLAPATVKQYQKEHRWDERVAIVDGKRWLVRQRVIEQEQTKDIAKFIDENRAIKNKSMKISKILLEKCETYAEEVISKADYKMKPHEFAKIYQTAVQMSRLVSELPTEITKTQILTPEEIDRMTPEEIQALIDKESADITSLEGIQNVGGVN